MATIAVFFAVGGGAAYAAHLVVRSNDIVNDQVKSADVRNDSLAGGGLIASDLRAGSVGPSEVGGLTGLDIANESLAQEDLASDAVGSGELRAVRVVSNSTSVPGDGGVGEVLASCALNEQLIGGGASFDFPSGELSKSLLVGTLPPQSWRAAGQNNGNVAQNLTAQALCLSP